MAKQSGDLADKSDELRKQAIIALSKATDQDIKNKDLKILLKKYKWNY